MLAGKTNLEYAISVLGNEKKLLTSEVTDNDILNEMLVTRLCSITLAERILSQINSEVIERAYT